MEPFTPDFAWERQVTCYCGKARVVTRRPPQFDKYAVCSFDCWNSMVDDGKSEPGALLMESHG